MCVKIVKIHNEVIHCKKKNYSEIQNLEQFTLEVDYLFFCLYTRICILV